MKNVITIYAKATAGCWLLLLAKLLLYYFVYMYGCVAIYIFANDCSFPLFLLPTLLLTCCYPIIKLVLL